MLWYSIQNILIFNFIYIAHKIKGTRNNFSVSPSPDEDVHLSQDKCLDMFQCMFCYEYQA